MPGVVKLLNKSSRRWTEPSMRRRLRSVFGQGVMGDGRWMRNKAILAFGRQA